jgi:AbiV family abortive infection protein
MAVDLGAVKAAEKPEIIRCAVGAAVNARDLLGDAEWLSAGLRYARAYALAAHAVEEAGKAVSLAALAVMPVNLRSRAPLGRMLEWHQLKLVGGMLIGAMPFGGRALPAQLAGMPADRIAGMLDDAHVLAQDVDRLKQHGLNADIDPRRIGSLRQSPRSPLGAFSCHCTPGSPDHLSSGSCPDPCRSLGRHLSIGQANTWRIGIVPGLRGGGPPAEKTSTSAGCQQDLGRPCS